jgi:pimeloyl-ACP methyl ester carboxylesterase
MLLVNYCFVFIYRLVSWFFLFYFFKIINRLRMKKLAPFFYIIAIGILFSCNNTENTKQEEPLHKTVSNNGVNISYTDTGKGDTTLLFVHGWCINKTYWQLQVDAFSNQYRVVTMDLPGFGMSGKNREVWSTEAYGNDVDSVIAQLGLKNVIVIGHSMAGDIVLQAAVNTPGNIIGLVGVDNFKGTGLPQSKEDSANYKQAIEQLKHNFKAVATQYFNEALFSKTTADTIKKRILADVYRADTVVAVKCMEEEGFNEVQKLIEAKKTLYLINSDVTPTDTTGLKANNIPYKVLYVHGTGHYPMIESPAEFNMRLQEVLADISKGGK